MSYEPEWEGKIEGYSKNQISKNLWKFVMLGYEYDDLLHEAVLVFCYCRDKYIVETPQHFMSLFKTALHNRFYDFAQSSSVEKSHQIVQELDFNLLGGSVKEESTFRVLLKSAPQEVKQVLSLVLNAPTEVLEGIGFRNKGSRGFTANRKLCGLLGYNPDEVNLVQITKSYFSL